MRYGKPTKNKRKNDPRYFLSENQQQKKAKAKKARVRLKEIAKEELEVLQEGAWEKIKNMVAKWGSLEKGGKIIPGKRKAWEEKAIKQYEDTLGQVSNVTVKELVKSIMDIEPEFPNQEAHPDFLRGLVELSYFYDTIADNVKKYNPDLPADKQPEGAIPPDVANGLVHALRTYVRFVLDSQLADAYKHFKEDIDRSSDDAVLEAQKLLEIEGLWDKDEVRDEALVEIFGTSGINWEKEYAKLMADEKPEGGTSGAEGAAAGGGEEKEGEEDEGPEDVLGVGKVGDESKESAVMKGLKGKALPILLSLLGGAGIAAEVAMLAAVGGPEMIHWDDIYKDVEVEEVGGQVEQILGDTVTVDTKGSGMIGVVSQAAGGGTPLEFANNIDRIADTTGHEPYEVIQSMGADLMKQGEDGGRAMQLLYDYNQQGGSINDFVRPGMPDEKFLEFVRDKDPDFLDQINVENSGTGFPGDKSLLGINLTKWTMIGKSVVVPMIIRYTQRVLVQKGGAMAGGAAGAGSALAQSGLLGKLGLAGIVAGAAIALIRLKGRKSSRAQMLDDLYGTLKYFPATTSLPKPPEVDPEPEPGPEPEPETEGVCRELISTLNGQKLEPGDVVTLQFAASWRGKQARKAEEGEEEGAIRGPDGNLKSRTVMISAIPGQKQLTGYSEKLTKGREIPSYEQQSKDHPRYIAVQVLNLTTKGDPFNFSPIAELVSDEGVRKRISSGGENNVKDQLLAGEMPEGFSYEYNVTKVDKSEEAFNKFMEDFKEQILNDEKREIFEKRLEPELRRRKEIGDQKTIATLQEAKMLGRWIRLAGLAQETTK